jgi:tRNA-Thr(GGU) m(6)t(6)A37 methyltransferase TsaA
MLKYIRRQGGKAAVMKVIAKIYTGFKEKFGIPRQSGIVTSRAKIVFEREYRVPEAIKGIDGYSHLWLIWQFSKSERDTWSPTVRPPRLGGNKRMGVFATRSPYRPNAIGLSSVKLISVEHTDSEGDVLIVEGADILDGTPIFDIKPYLAYTDSHPDAIGGFADGVMSYETNVTIPEAYASILSEEELSEIRAILAHDPRPGYKRADEKEYGMVYRDHEVFFVSEGDGLIVTRIIKKQ